MAKAGAFESVVRSRTETAQTERAEHEYGDHHKHPILLVEMLDRAKAIANDLFHVNFLVRRLSNNPRTIEILGHKTQREEA
mgnify:CR=1 FL=1